MSGEKTAKENPEKTGAEEVYAVDIWGREGTQIGPVKTLQSYKGTESNGAKRADLGLNIRSAVKNLLQPFLHCKPVTGTKKVVKRLRPFKIIKQK